MSIPEHFLEQLRACVNISEVAIRYGFRVRKEGPEFVCIDNKSLKINDKKRTWKDWGNGEKGGDVFQFLVSQKGFEFVEAVERVAEIAGLAVPRIEDGRAPQTRPAAQPTNGHGAGNGKDIQQNRGGGKGEIAVPVATWDYYDAAGNHYQVVRRQWRFPNGDWRRDDKTGKIDKDFFQRRRSPDVDGYWINSLRTIDERGVPIEFMRKGPDSNWTRFNEKNYNEWRFTERRTFESLGNVEHTLLHRAEIVEELAEPREEQRTIFLPEGEKKVDLLRSWGLLATCNSGGAVNWTEDMARLFEMMRNCGSLGKHRILSQRTVATMLGPRVSTGMEGVSQGLGWFVCTEPARQPALRISKGGFGVAGASGTFGWADPEQELVRLFLIQRFSGQPRSGMRSWGWRRR